MQHHPTSSSCLSSTSTLAGVLDLNNQASKLMLSGQHATAATILAEALALFKQFVASTTSHQHQHHNGVQQVETSIGGLRSTLPFVVHVVLSEVTLYRECEENSTPPEEPFLFQDPLVLVATSSSRNTTFQHEEGERMGRNLGRDDPFHSVPLAIIVNLAICHQARAMTMENPVDRDNGLRRVVQLYRHASKLLSAGGSNTSQRTEQECNHHQQQQHDHCPVELVILNNLGLAFTRLQECQQARRCYDALFQQATIHYKNSLSCCYDVSNDEDSHHHQNKKSLVDLFYFFIFAKMMGTPSVAAPAA